MDKAIMLDRIKEYYSFKTDADFAKFLEIKPQTFSNWKSRNTFDAELIYSKCSEINPSWLLCGKEPMIDKTKIREHELNEDKNPYILRKKLTYLEEEIKILTQADKIMDKSGDQLKKAIKLLTDQLQSTEEELQSLLKKKK